MLLEEGGLQIQKKCVHLPFWMCEVFVHTFIYRHRCVCVFVMSWKTHFVNLILFSVNQICVDFFVPHRQLATKENTA